MEAQPDIFKTYDIRGLYPSEINDVQARIIARASAHIFRNGNIVIAYDGRHGSEQLAESLSQGLKESSRTLKREYRIHNIGLSTKPMFYFTVINLNAAGGLMVTASHNPKEYNGINIVGRKATPISGLRIKELIEKYEIR